VELVAILSMAGRELKLLIDKSSTAGIGLYAGPSGNTIFQNIISNTTPTATSSTTAYVGAGILISATGADRNSASITAPDRNTISQNSIFRNMGLGIEIDPRDWYMGDGVTANTGSTSNIVPNIGMNYPVISTSSLSGSGTLSVAGYVGKETIAGAGDTDFANAKLEFFIADNTPANQDGEVILGDGLSKPHGEGKTYIGTCTADTNGLFNCSFPNAGTLGLTNAKDITATATDGAGNTSEFSATAVSNPNVLLVKRITAINGNTTNGTVSLNSYDPDPVYPYDKNVIQTGITPPTTDKWPGTIGSSSSTFLLGARDGGVTKPNDEVEYTIYFLSAGSGTAQAVQLCDRLPDHQAFVPNAYNFITPGPGVAPAFNADRGIALSYSGLLESYTNLADGDIAQYYPPGQVPLPDVCKTVANPNVNSNPTGAVVVNLGLGATGTTGGEMPSTNDPGSTNTAYGFVRFKVKNIFP
jgi:uncharacterized repeat protein (TIGR01451 family)